MVTTWATNFDAVQEESAAAADVLRLSAFVAPDDIPFELLTRGAYQLGPEVQNVLTGVESDTLLVNALLRPLNRFSLIRINGSNETYGIHRMVQEVLKSSMDDAARHLWSGRSLRAIILSIEKINDVNSNESLRLLPHAISVSSFILDNKLMFDDLLDMIDCVSSTLVNVGLHDHASVLRNRATELRRHSLSDRRPKNPDSLNSLASTHGLRTQSLDNESNPLGDDCESIAKSNNVIGKLLNFLGSTIFAEDSHSDDGYENFVNSNIFASIVIISIIIAIGLMFWFNEVK